MVPIKLLLFIGVATTVFQQINSLRNCVCTRDYEPVCSNNGITFSNKCTLNCYKEEVKGLDVLFSGLCTKAHYNLDPSQQKRVDVHTLHDEVMDNCLIPRMYDPLCGSDGKTYVNEWELVCAQKIIKNLEIISRGECTLNEMDEPILLCTSSVENNTNELI